MVWVILVTVVVYLTVHGRLAAKEQSISFSMPQWLSNPYVYILLGLFLLGMDAWAWGKTQPLIWGIPMWMGYFVLLSVIQTIVTAVWVKEKKPDDKRH